MKSLKLSTRQHFQIGWSRLLRNFCYRFILVLVLVVICIEQEAWQRTIVPTRAEPAVMIASNPAARDSLLGWQKRIEQTKEKFVCSVWRQQKMKNGKNCGWGGPERVERSNTRNVHRVLIILSRILPLHAQLPAAGSQNKRRNERVEKRAGERARLAYRRLRVSRITKSEQREKKKFDLRKTA